MGCDVTNAKVIEQLIEDVSFLGSQRFMDYSLLFAVRKFHCVKKSKADGLYTKSCKIDFEKLRRESFNQPIHNPCEYYNNRPTADIEVEEQENILTTKTIYSSDERYCF